MVPVFPNCLMISNIHTCTSINTYTEVTGAGQLFIECSHNYVLIYEIENITYF